MGRVSLVLRPVCWLRSTDADANLLVLDEVEHRADIQKQLALLEGQKLANEELKKSNEEQIQKMKTEMAETAEVGRAGRRGARRRAVCRPAASGRPLSGAAVGRPAGGKGWRRCLLSAGWRALPVGELRVTRVPVPQLWDG